MNTEYGHVLLIINEYVVTWHVEGRHCASVHDSLENTPSFLST